MPLPYGVRERWRMRRPPAARAARRPGTRDGPVRRALADSNESYQSPPMPEFASVLELDEMNLLELPPRESFSRNNAGQSVLQDNFTEQVGTNEPQTAQTGEIEESVEAEEIPEVVEGEIIDQSVVTEADEAVGFSAEREISEETEASLESEDAAGIEPTTNLSPEIIDAIAAKVVEKISDKVIREIAWEVVPQMTDLIVKRLAEEKLKE